MHRLSIALVFGTLFGCDDGGPTATALVHVSPLTWEDRAQACLSIEIRDADGAPTFKAGRPDLDVPTPTEAVAAGAICGTPDITTAMRCTPGAASVAVHMVGLWGSGPDGVRLEKGIDYVDPCGPDGCTLAFTCVADTETPVDMSIIVMAVANQGFFDLDINVTPPADAPELCYALRVTDSDGVEVLTRQRICSSRYGSGRDGRVTYLSLCSSGDGPEKANDNIITWWVHAPERSADGAEPWTNPCPVPQGAADNVVDWEGGCSSTARCVENSDTIVTLGGAK